MKTIYIVSGCLDREGGHPLRAFVSKQLAEDYEKECSKDMYMGCDYYVTYAVQLNEEV